MLKVANYKSFGEEHQGFDQILPVNVIIGRNNTGKSALLDLVHAACEQVDLSRHAHRGQQPNVRLSVLPTDDVIRQIFPETSSGGPLGGNHYEYGKKWIDEPVIASLGSDHNLSYVSSEPAIHQDFADKVAAQSQNPFSGITFRRIQAERSISPEGETAPPTLHGNGTGATNVIQHVINEASADETLIARDVLNGLNRVFEPDSSFARITTKRLDDRRWEIYLEEESKGSVPLSASGSGVQTVILVLLQLLVVPVLEQRQLSQYTFGFEELENNLHPGLQRRLFALIREIALEAGATFFVTTHSSVVIDMFSTDPEAQLLHVTHDKTSASVTPLIDYASQSTVLDDLDVRASDLLQSNGILWLEGPSDRVYLNHYLQLRFGDRFREGTHYQCVFYGGKVLARLTADPDEYDATNLLKVNRNCAIVMDRDTDVPNATKKRLRTEVEQVDGHVWITDKKEIESYLPLTALQAYYDNPSLRPIGELEGYGDYLLDVVDEAESKRYLNRKVLYSERVIAKVTKDMVEADADLLGHLQQLADVIAKWNPGV